MTQGMTQEMLQQFSKEMRKEAFLRPTLRALRDLAVHPRRELKAGWDTIQKLPRGWKVFTHGANLAGAHADAKKQDWDGRERGVGERVLGTAGGLVGNIAAARHGFFPAMAVGGLASEGGRTLGRVTDRASSAVLRRLKGQHGAV